MNTHNKRKLEDEDERGIVPDGQSIRVSMMALDSVQKQIAAMDERVQHNIEAGQATLAAMQHDSDRAQAHADHYSAQRAAQTDTSAYGAHCQRISEAWKQVAA